MYCHNCGVPLTDDSVFCTQCGTKQKALSAVSQTQSVAQFSSGNTQIQLKTLDLWIAIAVFLCWPAAIYGLIQRGKAKKALTPEEANVIVKATVKGMQIWCAIVLSLLLLGAILGL